MIDNKTFIVSQTIFPIESNILNADFGIVLGYPLVTVGSITLSVVHIFYELKPN